MPRTAKPQRTDLNKPTQAIKVAPSQQYGQGAQQLAAQKAIPLPNNAGPPTPSAPPAPMPTAAPTPVAGDLGALDRPTERPSEPLTAGLPIGAGPGPEVLSNQDAQVGMQLRALYMKFPNQDIRDLIEAADNSQELFGNG